MILTSDDLLLIRHGTTDMAGTLCGQSDPPLNEEGRRQARTLASVLANAPVCRLYCSDLQRAIQTARPLADAWRIKVTPDKNIREISFGDWEGKRWADIRESLLRGQRFDSAPQFCAPGGEAFAAFRERALQAFRDIISDSSGVCSAVVTHLGVIRVVLQEWFRSGSESPSEKRMDYCAAYRLDLGSMSSELLRISATTDASGHLRAVLEQK